MVNRKHCCFQWKGEPIRPIQIGVGECNNGRSPNEAGQVEGPSVAGTAGGR